MPSLLRPRLSCFYCGARSQYLKDGQTRQFYCQKCTATNYLDKHGDVADPPAATTTTPTTPGQSQRTYAHPRPRPQSPSPMDSTTGEHLFCKTCLKNQHLYTACLAEYLPSDDHPDYEKYEARLPQYKKDLEKRYPQVCPQCAPKVRDRIRKTGYAAKVDFLTRNLERSKNMALTNESPSTVLLGLLLTLASVAWRASLLVQIVWHTFGLLDIREEASVARDMSTAACAVSILRYGAFPAGCGSTLSTTVYKSILVYLCLIWWNPTLKTRLRISSRNCQSKGVLDYYRFQVIILAARYIAWWNLSRVDLHEPSHDFVKGAHGCALLFLTIGLVASTRMVSYFPAPKVIFHDSTGELIEPGSFQYPAQTSHSEEQPLGGSYGGSPARHQPFSISNLAPRRPHTPRSTTPDTAASPASTIPSPPPDNNNDFDPADSMDWEPVRKSSPLIRRTAQPLQPTLPYQTAQSAFPSMPSFMQPPKTAEALEKSPFTGRLPPAPKSMEHRLRNPAPPAQFKPTPVSKQQDFFKKMGLSSSASAPQDAKAERTSRAGAPTSTSYVRSDKKDDYAFAEPKWTLKSDLDKAAAGTGLEDMFTSSFKLEDEAPWSRPSSSSSAADAPSGNQQSEQQQRRRRGQRGAGDGREFLAHHGSEGTGTQQHAFAHVVRIVKNEIELWKWPVTFGVLAALVTLAVSPGLRASVLEGIKERLRALVGWR